MGILERDPTKQVAGKPERINALVATIAATLNDRLQALVDTHNGIMRDLFEHPEFTPGEIFASVDDAGADLLGKLDAVKSFVGLVDPGRANLFTDTPVRVKRGDKEFDLTVTTKGDKVEVVEAEVVKADAELPAEPAMEIGAKPNG